MPDFRQEDADELHRTSAEVFGGWERRSADGQAERKPGILERLERIERLVKVGIAAGVGVGTVMGSLVTLLVQHWLGIK